MTTAPDGPECPTGTAQVARDLTAALNTMSGRLKEVKEGSEERDKALAKYGRRNRHLITGLIISVVIDIALTIAIAVVAVQANHATTTARAAYASNAALCHAGNVARHQQVELWEFVLSVSRPPQTARQRHVIAEFQTHLHQIFAARNCAALGKGTR